MSRYSQPTTTNIVTMKYFILVAFVLGLASAKVDKFAKNCATVGRSFDGLFTQQVCEFDCLYFGRNVGCSSNGTEYCRHHQCTNTNLAFRQTTIEKRFNHMEKLDLNLTNFRYEICFDVEEINLDQVRFNFLAMMICLISLCPRHQSPTEVDALDALTMSRQRAV